MLLGRSLSAVSIPAVKLTDNVPVLQATARNFFCSISGGVAKPYHSVTSHRPTVSAEFYAV